MNSDRITLFILCLITFFGMSGSTLLGPVLPTIVEPLNTSREAVGLILAVYTLSTALFTLVIGSITDKINHKKILIPCLIINGLSGMAAFFATDLTLLLFIRFIQGSAVAGMTPLAMTIIGGLYSGKQRIHAMGRRSMSIAIGAVSLPFIGGSMGVFGWNFPFLFYSLTIPIAIVAVFALPETNPEEFTGKATIEFTDIKEALKDFRVTYTIFLSFAIAFLLYSVIIYVPFILEDSFDFTSQGAGIALSLRGASVIVVASQARKLSEIYSEHIVMSAGFGLLSAAIAGFPFVNTVSSTFFLLLLFGAGFGMIQPFLTTLIIQVSPSNIMGGIVSIFNTMKYIGQTAAPSVLGIVLFYFNMDMIFIVSSIFGFIIALSVYLTKARFYETNQ